MSTRDAADRRRAMILLAIAVLAAVFVVGLLVSLAVIEVPRLAALMEETFSPGLGLRSAAIIAAVISFVVLIAFAVASGDGLLGELPFVIGGFFVFFLFFWIMTAWVF